MAHLVTGYAIRPIQARDKPAVLALINNDRLAGQPRVTGQMLAEALACRSPVDSGWWAELDQLTTQVATSRTGRVVGAVSYATRPATAQVSSCVPSNVSRYQPSKVSGANPYWFGRDWGFGW